ncbi:MAG: Rieske 2Fe-2S domain-containing protein [Methylovulum sp.]|uniref:Rieske (2Fe-2S) protein n=1 Tax=Methylovulum sp. TaxID=1916980 RepID=UPI00260A42FC|nr:Rieske 2Fe-2S domain-containing protein [Methylovulum sp.]MDD2722895.1 Rieske 2Fe-2S domain-containing protein [Methylovulum sp.]MDD5124852.1 Rieske 2Fe-2S domain-containing protein [Methylovulum sp.]
MQDNKLKVICSLEDLCKVSYLTRKIIFKGQPGSALVFLFDGHAYSYVNHCMHMHRPLNCEEDAVFDETGKLLRCSMHGFVFDPKTGECQSPVCLGQRLQALRLQESDGILFFAEKHLVLAD